MSKELVISAAPHETRVAIVEDGQLCETYVEREKEFALVGSIYKGRVTRVLPGMQSAFVDIGLDGDAFLYVSDFFENLEEYDQIVSSVEGKVERMEQQGGQVFAAPAGGCPGPAITEPPEVTAGGSAETNESAAAAFSPAPPAPTTHSQPRAHEPRGHGPDRGRGRHWGRRGRGAQRHGRESPTSKYPSTRAYQPPPGEEPIILPGESLAKYKDRIPAPTPATVAPAIKEAPLSEAAPEASASAAARAVEEPLGTEAVTEAPEAAAVLEPDKAAANELEREAALPAGPGEASSAPERPAEGTPVPTRALEEVSEPALPESAFFHPKAWAEWPVEEEQAEQAAKEETEAEITEEEALSLSEQLAEAKHEEARAKAEAEATEEGEEAEAEAASEGELPAGEEVEGTTEAEAPEAAVEAAAVEGVAEHEAKPLTAKIEERVRARFQRPMPRGRRHRGRSARYRVRREPPRRSQMISELLKPGQEIIVQIAKEPLGKKGARITSHVALPGRCLVYMPTVEHIGVSRKINSAEGRARLRRIVAEAKGKYPGGFIVRTAAEGASEEEIRSDVEFLGRTWTEILARAEQRKAPTLLHRDLNLVERILRDHLSSDYTAIWVDNEEEFTKVVEFVGRFQPGLVNRVKLYTKDAPIFEEFGIQQELDKALRPKVWLKSGGYIVINHTEALVAIDVNTGKYVGRGSTRLEDTIVKTNLEAVKEIVRQIRLRDLGGIIVVDFIDMEERRNRDKVMQALEEALRADRAPSKVLSFNEFGLVAITRKRTKQALERVLCQPCPYCTGSGMVKSIPTICYEIQAEARKMAADLDGQSITLRVHPEIAKALKTREAPLMDELEQQTHKSVIIQADPTLHWEQYDIH